MSNSLSLKDPATPGEQLFNYLLSHERRYGFHVLRMVSSSGETDDVTTEFVLAKQWTYKSMQRYAYTINETKLEGNKADSSCSFSGILLN